MSEDECARFEERDAFEGFEEVKELKEFERLRRREAQIL
jgi:hypothetical protein